MRLLRNSHKGQQQKHMMMMHRFVMGSCGSFSLKKDVFFVRLSIFVIKSFSNFCGKLLAITNLDVLAETKSVDY